MSTPKNMVKGSDETRLGEIAKRLLATPHKPREASKVGKHRAKSAKSPRKSKRLQKGR